MNYLDIFYIIKWFFTFLVIGVVFLPLTFSLFSDFKDKGYIFSKIFGMAFISYAVFILGLLRIFKFSQDTVYILLILFFIINYYIFRKIKTVSILRKNLKVFIFEELIFLASLAIWAFVRGNMPDIHGLEKFMDFGFLNSILRSDFFPPQDMWYAKFPINYYYFGHLITAVIIKISAIPSSIGYNLMIATLFAFAFTASLSLGINLFDNKKFSLKSLLSGFISALLVSLGGNLTTVYSLFKAYLNDNPVPFWKLPFLPFSFPNNFWYPNATRFIPFTIHEFPLYSFVVSDLHGHVIDIPFVLLALSLGFAFLIKKRINFLHIMLLSFLFSIMYMTNAWDGPIYLLLGFGILIIHNFRNNNLNYIKDNIVILIRNIITLIIGFFVFSFPFSLHFKPFVSGIGILCVPDFLIKLNKIGPFLFEANHCQKSPIWQLTLLYGFFYFFVISFLIFLKTRKDYKLSKNVIYLLFLIILSSILIAIPEFMYIKDIYPMHYRANTMFKLAYEAFIMLSLCCGFILITLISKIRSKKILLPYLIVCVVILFFVLIYPVFAVNSYYRDLKKYEGLNGTLYLASQYPGDYALINWINNNIAGQPIILEANGDSYTDFARISANTGLPTIIGWPVHEWLWRGTYDVVAPRISDVETLYTSRNIKEVTKLIKRYHISYVVFSSLEKQKYPNLNEKIIQALGKIVFRNTQTTLYKLNF